MTEEEFAEARVTTFDIFKGTEPSGIKVEWRGEDQWAVTRAGLVLSHNGTWHYEPLPSNRTDEWKREHRFGKSVAIDLAMAEIEQGPKNE